MIKNQSTSASVRFLDSEQVCEKLALSRSALYRAIRAGTLPKATKINARVARWSESHIDRAMQKLSGRA